MDLTVNSVKIKNPSDYDISRYTITKAKRNAAGRMNADIITKKVKLFLSYDAIEARDFDLINDLINGDQFFFDVTYQDAIGRKHTKVMYTGEIRTPLARQDPLGGWVWQGVSINLIER